MRMPCTARPAAISSTSPTRGFERGAHDAGGPSHRRLYFFFYSNEGDPREPIHVHVRRGGSEA
ncbi:DUF4160 domain-containing protein [Ciceribacter selenitireducens]|uniref:DUF4160 domain-containing protein n=1 Tax=Ciceribacter selenitireducens TaxID=448181 RepID=UPI002E26563A